MEKDIRYLKEYKKQVSANFVNQFKITKEAADELLRLLETEDLIRIEAPEYQDKPVTVLTKDRHLIRNELGMTSHKMGNIILNTYLDWKKLAVAALASVSTIAGIDMGQPFLACVGIMSAFFSASELTNIKITENGTAIIMALQNYKKNRAYMLKEEQCKNEANEILSFHGYDEMTEKTFLEEVTKLINYQCIEEQNGMIRLKEKVITHY